MKKIYILPILTVFIALTACQDDNYLTGSTGQGITATIANDEDAATRAMMIDAPTQAVNLRWTAGDAIGVFDASNNNTRFEASAADISDDNTRAVFRANGAVPQAEFLAYYPYNQQASGTTTELHLNMGSKQQYVIRDFKTEPDPEACIMVGKGYANSVDFRNVNAILKISYVPRDSDIVTSVVFRDLTGQPVTGAFTITLDSDGKPVATYPATNDEQPLMLDCGAGVSVTPTVVSTFFLVVPARNYTKGFQLDFQLASGKTDVRTIGRRSGKELKRSMVYGVGDVSVITKDDYSVVFGEGGGVIMDDDLMAMVNAVIPLGERTVEDENGIYYDLMTKPGTGLKEGMTVVINQPSEVLPYGLTGKIVTIKDLGDSQQVRVKQYAHAEQAYKKLLIGPANALNADGTPDEEKMLSLDLTSHFAGFVPAEDMEGVTVEMTSQGLVMSDNSWPASAPLTRASAHRKLEFPRFALNLKTTGSDRFSVGASPAIMAGIGASITDYNIDYIAFTFTPTLTLDVSIEKTIELANIYDDEKLIGEMLFTPITVGPVVLIPVMKLSGFASLKGLVKLSATWSYTLGFNVGGTYQNAYGSPESGWRFRCSNQCQGIPSLGSMLLPSDLSATASLAAQSGMILDAGLSFFGIIDFTLYVKSGMELSAYIAWKNMGLTMTPICEGGAAVGLIGLNPKRKALAQIDSKPWWQRDLYPEMWWITAIENNMKGGNYYPAYPAESIDYIPINSALGGALLHDCKLEIRVVKGTSSSDPIVATYPLKDVYPASTLLFEEVIERDKDGNNYMPIIYHLSKDLIAEEGQPYSVFIYCTSDGATLGQVAPTKSHLGHIEITRRKNVWRSSKAWEGEYFLISDDNYETTVKDDGEIKIERRY